MGKTKECLMATTTDAYYKPTNDNFNYGQTVTGSLSL
jgi:hypothetical protein